MSFALSPDAMRLACVAVWNLSVMFSWQSAQASEPANSAPAICGGATIVLVIPEQEFTMTAVSPAAHTTPSGAKTRRCRVDLVFLVVVRRIIAVAGSVGGRERRRLVNDVRVLRGDHLHPSLLSLMPSRQSRAHPFPRAPVRITGAAELTDVHPLAVCIVRRNEVCLC
jgi:hypothetical protein